MKTAFGFLGGTVFATLAVMLAGGRPAVMIWLGFGLAVAILIGTLKLAGLRRAARFLNAFADGIEAKSGGDTRTEQAEDPKKADPLAADVASALMNQGVREATAVKIAATATRSNKDFDSAFRAALTLVPAKKAGVA